MRPPGHGAAARPRHRPHRRHRPTGATLTTIVCPIIPSVLIATSREVAQAIHAAHGDLQKWSSWTLPGDVMTEWALPGADAPLLRQRTTYEWAQDATGLYRTNEKHEQWLIVVAAERIDNA
jgi:hypothetical protein